jgi:DNA-directed RNA polymerase II subunit RPB2
MELHLLVRMCMSMITKDISNKIMESYFKQVSLVKPQLDSFNHFITHGIQDIVKGSEINLKLVDNKFYKVVFGEVYVNKPILIENQKVNVLFPNDARMRDLSYVGNVVCDIIEYWYDENKKVERVERHNRISIARIPIMVGSVRCNLYGLSDIEKIEKGECEKSPGGFFIIKGNERVILGQIRSNYNRPYIIIKEDKIKKYFISEVRSMSESTNHSVFIQVKLNTYDKKTTINMPHITDNIPIGIIFKAYGIKDIRSLIGLSLIKKADDYIHTIESECAFINSSDDAVSYISRYVKEKKDENEEKKKRLNDIEKVEFVKQILDMELLPHLSISSTSLKKAYFIARIVRKLIESVLGIRNSKDDERDNIANKRVETVGILYYELFVSLFKKYISSLIQQLEKKKYNVSIINNVITNVNNITTNLHHSFATGSWGVKKNNYIRTGVSQVLTNMTYASTISHMRRVVCPVGKEAHIKIRQINGSQFGFLCPSETPESETAGVVLNLCVTCDITNHVQTILVRDAIKLLTHIPLINNELKITDDMVPILLNEDIIGFSRDPTEFVHSFRKFRNSGFIDYQVSIVYDYMDNEIRICSDKGRFTRPLFVVDEFRKRKPDEYNWNYLLSEGFIRYVDCNEIEWSYLSITPSEINDSHEYCEIHTSNQFGHIASCIPFYNHSQAPRNVYQSSMGKQALGVFSYAYQNRTDTSNYVMWYPQKSLVVTKFHNYMGFSDMPSGITCIVAIAPFQGYNQEDSIVMKKEAIERGLFVTTKYKTITEIEKKKCLTTSEIICIPPLTTNKKPGEPGYFKRTGNNYSLLDNNGLIRQGSIVRKGDVIIGKILIKTTKEGDIKTDISVTLKGGDEGVIDRVYTKVTTDGQKIVKIVIRQLKIPEPGDKFAARSAQKGTCSTVTSQIDMPFTKDGIVPDIMINPHCIPSRMTINQLLECVLGKKCAIKGEYGDCTAFTLNRELIQKTICDELSKYGFSGKGTEVMYNGMTGEAIESMIFIGPTYYQRLKHIVKNKMHARSTGAVTSATRQPLCGRSMDGGLRVGEMERDCMISHGVAEMVKDRLFYCSDKFTVNVCEKCGEILSSQVCKICGKDTYVNVNIPYACKTMLQQLQSMAIRIKLNC